MAKNRGKVVPILEAMAKLISANRLRLEYTECGCAASIVCLLRTPHPTGAWHCITGIESVPSAHMQPTPVQQHAGS